MSTPHKCPVCNGTGQVYISNISGTTATVPPVGVCHACGGTGIVWDTRLDNVPEEWKTPHFTPSEPVKVIPMPGTPAEMLEKCKEVLEECKKVELEMKVLLQERATGGDIKVIRKKLASGEIKMPWERGDK